MRRYSPSVAHSPAAVALLVPLLLVSSLTAVRAETESFFWRVDPREPGGAAVYLLGSVHVLREEHYPLPSAMEQAYQEAEVVVFESDMEAAASPELQALMLRKGVYTDGTTVRDHISEDLYAMLGVELEELGDAARPLLLMKPALLSTTLTVIELAKLGYRPDLGVDQHFFRRAAVEGKRIETLESPEFQMNLLLDLTDEEQEAYLRETLEGLADIEELVSEMIAAWRDGDSVRMVAATIPGTPTSPVLAGFYSRLTVERNRRWIPRIERFLRGEGVPQAGGTEVLVVLGALHLAGEDSVVDLLRRRGHRVSRMQDR